MSKGNDTYIQPKGTAIQQTPKSNNNCNNMTRRENELRIKCNYGGKPNEFNIIIRQNNASTIIWWNKNYNNSELAD